MTLAMGVNTATFGRDLFEGISWLCNNGFEFTPKVPPGRILESRERLRELLTEVE